MSIVRVALDVPLATLFDYMADDAVAVGQRVLVPFGNRKLVGVVMEYVVQSSVTPERLRQVLQVLPDNVPMSALFLSLMRFCSEYYHYPIGQAVFTALPTRLRTDNPVVRKPVTYFRLSAAGEALASDAIAKRKAVARRILTRLSGQSCTLAQLRMLSASAGVQLKWLVEQGWVESVELSPAHLGSSSTVQVRPHTFANAHTLTAEQRLAVDAVTQARGYECFLLHGVTGSGKTEVYVHLIHEALQQGGQVLLLVPEINLTPQLESYFRSRFPDTELVSLHSGLSENQRLSNWQQAQSGVAQIILGTRLAVFAELPGLALILVDEEHDTSFKQQDGLRYSARDVAIFRARQCEIPIVLGSATPSLETYFNAQNGRYRRLRLTARALAAATLPAISCINTHQTVMFEGISEKLLREIGLRIGRGEQSLLFINRRGYAPVLMCTECGWLSDCKNCAGKMVLHLKDRAAALSSLWRSTAYAHGLSRVWSCQSASGRQRYAKGGECLARAFP